jgi:plastocyanin
VIVALACLLLAGCGGGDKGSSGSAIAHVRAGQPLRVAAHEYRFSPGKVVVESEGGPLRAELDNRGSLPHNLKILGDGAEVGGTATIPGGRRARASVSLAPGRYTLICTVGNHADLGMIGELQVERP